MWKSYIIMNEVNQSDGSFNLTCYNETNGTCAVTAVPPMDLKWALLGLILVIFCTALGNLLVCLAVCWDRRLQNMTNYFLMSLAIADFLVSIIVMPFGLVVELHGYFPFGGELCAFWVTMDVLMCTASIWHMCTMSMDRYFTLKYPMQYGRNKTKTMVAMKILFVWAVSIAISSPICIHGFVDSHIVLNDSICVPTLKEFVIYGSIFAFYIPLIIMVLTYFLTVRLLVHNQSMMRTIDRSDFRLRSRHNKYSISKSCQITTLLSPPSSNSQRELSHTEVTSLARTPNCDNVIITNKDKNDRYSSRFHEMKQSVDSAYMNNISSVIPNGNQCVKSSGTEEPDNSHAKYMESESRNEMKSITSDGRGSMRRYMDDDWENTCNTEDYTEILSDDNLSEWGVEDNLPVIEFDDNRAGTSNQDLNTEKHENNHLSLVKNIPTIVSQPSSPILPEFRPRRYTDVASQYSNAHSSLKIPKAHEKQQLQSSVSCSRITQNTESSELSLDSPSAGLNRDYKSLEWSQHFYQIQEEMDQCLRDSRLEKKRARKQNSTTELTSLENKDRQKTSVENTDVEDTHKSTPRISDIESGDSLDDLDDSSSDTNSDMLTIKLYPKSVYMYKLHVPKKSRKQKPVSSPKNGHIRVPNGLITRRGGYMRANSNDSDKSNEVANKIITPKRNSLKAFMKHVRHNKQGIKNFLSTKTTTNERKASKVLGIIFGVFVVLWTPFFIVNLLSVTCTWCMDQITPTMMSTFVWMGYIASLANPIIYTMFNTAFRRAFIRILTCQMCQKESLMSINRSSYVPSYAASVHATSVHTDRRQTMTLLLNKHDDRLGNGLASMH